MLEQGPAECREVMNPAWAGEFGPGVAALVEPYSPEFFGLFCLDRPGRKERFAVSDLCPDERGCVVALSGVQVGLDATGDSRRTPRPARDRSQCPQRRCSAHARRGRRGCTWLVTMACRVPAPTAAVSPLGTRRAPIRRSHNSPSFQADICEARLHVTGTLTHSPTEEPDCLHNAKTGPLLRATAQRVTGALSVTERATWRESPTPVLTSQRPELRVLPPFHRYPSRTVEAPIAALTWGVLDPPGRPLNRQAERSVTPTSRC